MKNKDSWKGRALKEVSKPDMPEEKRAWTDANERPSGWGFGEEILHVDGN